MPIRFRCPFCNQRLGIGSRKAGTVVSCPTCHGQVTVPPAEGPPAGASPQRSAPAAFERSDFEELFRPPEPAESPVATVEPSSNPFAALGFPPVPQEKPLPTGYDVEPLGPAVGLPEAIPTAFSPGILLSPRQATLLTISVILLLALAFGAGLAVGRYLL
jgi:hypothetical protein